MKHLLMVAASAVLAGAYILMPTPAGQDGPALDTAAFETTPARAPAPSPAAEPTPAPSPSAEAAERFAAEKPDPEDVPEEALLAYQRAAQILGEVSPKCELPWTLLAAIGGVESDHGRHPGSSTETGAVPRSAVKVPTARGESPIAADGPMQISPSLWSVVGVDADGDGERSVRDLDDAALGAGVFLCAGWDGLADPRTMAEAVGEYRDSDAFVDLVLTFERAYRSVELLSPDRVVPPTPPVLSDVPVAQAELNIGQGTPARVKDRAVKDSKKAVAGAKKSGDKLGSATRDRKGDRAPLPEAKTGKKKRGKADAKTSVKPVKQSRPAKSKPAKAGNPSVPGSPGAPTDPATGKTPTPSKPGTPASETPGSGSPGTGTPSDPKPGGDKPPVEPAPGCQQPKPSPPGQTPGSSPGSTPDPDASGTPSASSSATPSGTPTSEAGRTPEESGSPSADEPGDPSPGCGTP